MRNRNRIDLNSDLGESYGSYKIGLDEEVLDLVTSANIACGFHAGDYNTMYETVQMAKEKNVGIGAHPGLLDLHGFGRRMIQVDPEEVYRFTLYQVGALQSFCKVHKVPMQHVKAHGALFNMAAKDKAIAEAIARAVYELDKDLILFGLSGSEIIRAGETFGLRTASEVFADRTYQPDGHLTSRTERNAMITDVDQAVEQVLRMIYDEKVIAVDGSELPVKADTICVHGDEPHALEFVTQLSDRLTQEGIQIKNVGS